MRPPAQPVVARCVEAEKSVCRARTTQHAASPGAAVHRVLPKAKPATLERAFARARCAMQKPARAAVAKVTSAYLAATTACADKLARRVPIVAHRAKLAFRRALAAAHVRADHRSVTQPRVPLAAAKATYVFPEMTGHCVVAAALNAQRAALARFATVCENAKGYPPALLSIVRVDVAWATFVFHRPRVTLPAVLVVRSAQIAQVKAKCARRAAALPAALRPAVLPAAVKPAFA
jgi:hypothetical protein